MAKTNKTTESKVDNVDKQPQEGTKEAVGSTIPSESNNVSTEQKESIKKPKNEPKENSNPETGKGDGENPKEGAKENSDNETLEDKGSVKVSEEVSEKELKKENEDLLSKKVIKYNRSYDGKFQDVKGKLTYADVLERKNIPSDAVELLLEGGLIFNVRSFKLTNKTI